ncbi:hypothetical protein SKAU_G00111410 [Synaphobranchus kaupii]|uniref:Uncharacterized protein n=1 Tax=Synaphobranchus kaupii TaxID=118154 RepID=A0A9Q1G1B0_SYNKA|nr:hypothetical protein SKAU_G00111410 [Synaphobranchus kaupii]
MARQLLGGMDNHHRLCGQSPQLSMTRAPVLAVIIQLQGASRQQSSAPAAGNQGHDSSTIKGLGPTVTEIAQPLAKGKRLTTAFTSPGDGNGGDVPPSYLLPRALPPPSSPPAPLCIPHHHGPNDCSRAPASTVVCK